MNGDTFLETLSNELDGYGESLHTTLTKRYMINGAVWLIDSIVTKLAEEENLEGAIDVIGAAIVKIRAIAKIGSGDLTPDERNYWRDAVAAVSLQRVRNHLTELRNKPGQKRDETANKWANVWCQFRRVEDPLLQCLGASVTPGINSACQLFERFAQLDYRFHQAMFPVAPRAGDSGGQVLWAKLYVIEGGTQFPKLSLAPWSSIRYPNEDLKSLQEVLFDKNVWKPLELGKDSRYVLDISPCSDIRTEIREGEVTFREPEIDAPPSKSDVLFNPFVEGKSLQMGVLLAAWAACAANSTASRRQLRSVIVTGCVTLADRQGAIITKVDGIEAKQKAAAGVIFVVPAENRDAFGDNVFRLPETVAELPEWKFKNKVFFDGFDDYRGKAEPSWTNTFPSFGTEPGEVQRQNHDVDKYVIDAFFQGTEFEGPKVWRFPKALSENRNEPATRDAKSWQRNEGHSHLESFLSVPFDKDPSKVLPYIVGKFLEKVTSDKADSSVPVPLNVSALTERFKAHQSLNQDDMSWAIEKGLKSLLGDNAKAVGNDVCRNSLLENGKLVLVGFFEHIELGSRLDPERRNLEEKTLIEIKKMLRVRRGETGHPLLIVARDDHHARWCEKVWNGK